MPSISSDLRNGSNTLDLLSIGNAPMDLPPTIANINLVVRTNGAVSPPPGPPTNLRIIRAMLLFPQSFMGRPDAVAGTRTYPLAH